MSGAELYQSASLADSSSKFLSLVSHLVIRTSGDSPSVGIQAREVSVLMLEMWWKFYWSWKRRQRRAQGARCVACGLAGPQMTSLDQML
jgi:hypothetical protein